MAVSSEYRVNIIISSKDKTSQGAKTATKSLDALRIAATLAAAGYAALKVAQKGIDFVKQGAEAQRAANALDNLAAMAGQSGDEIIRSIQEASDFTIDKMTAMRVANKAMLMGVAQSPEQFRELARTATILGRAMGLDATTAIDRFTIAAGRKSVKVADDLGLLIDASIANEKYAKTLGKTVDQLTASEQSQAFLNAMMEAAEPKVRALSSANVDLAGTFEQISSLAKDVTTDLADVVAIYADVTVKQAAFLTGGEAQLTDFRTAWSGFIGDWKAGIIAGTGTAAMVARKALPSWEMLNAELQIDAQRMNQYTMATYDATTITATLADEVPNLTFETRKYLDELAEHESLGDDFIHTSRDIASVIREQVAREAAEASRELDEYNLAIAEFSLTAGMQWTSYFRDVDEQTEKSALDREKMEADHQKKINDLLLQGQSRAIQIDEEAELAKLEKLQTRLAIALQSQAEFTEKTKLSTRMRKDAEIANLQSQIAEQSGLLDNYYGGRLETAGKNVDALIAEENRRHEEAVAGLEEEIEKTKELQRQQLGTLLLQTFEGWGKMKDIPPEAMFDMRLAIAKEYGLIGEEEAKYLELATTRWETWAAEDFKKPADEVLNMLATEILQVQKFGQTLAELESPPPIYIDVYYRSHGRGEESVPTAYTGMGVGLPSNVSNEYNFNQTVNTQATAANVQQDWETLKALVP